MDLITASLIFVGVEILAMFTGLVRVMPAWFSVPVTIAFTIVPSWFAWVTGLWPFYLLTGFIFTAFVFAIANGILEANRNAS